MKPRSSWKNAIYAMLKQKAPRKDSSHAAVEHHMMIGTQHNYVARNVRPKMWSPEGSEMMAFCIEMIGSQDNRLSADLTYSPVSLLKFDDQQRAPQTDVSKNFLGLGRLNAYLIWGRGIALQVFKVDIELVITSPNKSKEPVVP
jgi:hypothetical protein